MKGTTNPRKREIIEKLYARKEPIFNAIAKELERPARHSVDVNLSKIDKYAKDKGAVIIPGKVLGNGELKKDVTVVAYAFSEAALKKIQKKMTLAELLEKNIKIKGLQILK